MTCFKEKYTYQKTKQDRLVINVNKENARKNKYVHQIN